MKNICRLIAIFLAVAPVLVYGQSKGAIKQAIEAKYTLAQTNEDRTDLSAAGSVIVMEKDDLTLGTTASIGTRDDGSPMHLVEPSSTYKGGKFSKGGLTRFNKFLSVGNTTANTSAQFHNLVGGQKCWLIGDEVADDGVILEFMSDPVNGVRFKGFVKYPFPAKGQIPPVDVVMATIAETIKTDGAPPAAEAAAAPAAPPAPAMAEIPPPPPPADTPPPTLEKGQTKDQVVAAFGQPTKVVKIGVKEIDYYKDMKITYVSGKVSNVE